MISGASILVLTAATTRHGGPGGYSSATIEPTRPAGSGSRRYPGSGDDVLGAEVPERPGEQDQGVGQRYRGAFQHAAPGDLRLHRIEPGVLPVGRQGPAPAAERGHRVQDVADDDQAHGAAHRAQR